MGLRPAKSHEKLVLQDWWGGPPWSAADAPVGLLAPRKMLMSLCRLRDEGVPRGPRGPPHQAPRVWFFDPVYPTETRTLPSPRVRRSPLQHRHPREPLFHRRRHQLRGHFRQRLARYHALPLRIPFQADVERHVEEYRFHFAFPGAANRQIRPPLLGRQIGGIDV